MSGDLEDAFDLHGHTKRQGASRDCRTGMAAFVAQRLNHKIGRAVDDLWLVGEVRRGVHK
eukprot:CAMPEP_0184469950 /NCGR_PEP_ID=MMETSP0740-20130409/89148_1 /TAXON_ID=385413 /ORGANISM="Thalassiosira miniscula, Strain CCMP1093" /LENGTH=59 /DNA_ID=CAMNT_0026846015 /DNA_START=13 /DNA_END=189 /DNA_ORIENTATION=-